MFKKKVFIILLLVVFLIFSINMPTYATVPVTEEKLNEVLQSLKSSDSMEGFDEISISNGKMVIKEGERKYTIDYDLTGNPKFTVSVPIKQGMSYEEYKENTENYFLLMAGYCGVASIQGADIENAGIYYALNIMDKYLSSLSNSSSKYIIASDSADITSEDSTVIDESDFGNHVMEYTNSVYSKKQIFSDDSENLLNTFIISIEQTEVTENSCNLVSTLTVNLDADFSKIDEFVNALDPYNEITEQNADYVLKLKVGQKCKIRSNEKITGYSIYGGSVKFSNKNRIITAVKTGNTKGYLDVGDSDTKKSIYISVEENKNNDKLDSITLDIGDVSGIEEEDIYDIEEGKTISEKSWSDTIKLSELKENEIYKYTANSTTQFPKIENDIEKNCVIYIKEKENDEYEEKINMAEEVSGKSIEFSYNEYKEGESFCITYKSLENDKLLKLIEEDDIIYLSKYKDGDEIKDKVAKKYIYNDTDSDIIINIKDTLLEKEYTDTALVKKGKIYGFDWQIDSVSISYSKNNTEEKNSDDINNQVIQKQNEVNNTDDNTKNENKVANISIMPKTGKVQNLILNLAYISIVIAFIGIFSLIIKRK